MLDFFLCVALIWIVHIVVMSHVLRKRQARHAWGEFNSAQIARMRRRPDRR